VNDSLGAFNKTVPADLPIVHDARIARTARDRGGPASHDGARSAAVPGIPLPDSAFGRIRSPERDRPRVSFQGVDQIFSLFLAARID
jgi:hypothetical protein